jgi:dTDP-4-amino-4,6-dideoxygalactose transaminase
LPGVTLYELPSNVTHSEQYLVLRLRSADAASPGALRDAAFNLLRQNNILARRYFYPLCSDFPHYRALASAAADHLPVSTRAAQEMLCLPLHGGVSEQAVADMAFLLSEAIASIQTHA